MTTYSVHPCCKFSGNVALIMSIEFCIEFTFSTAAMISGVMSCVSSSGSALGSATTHTWYIVHQPTVIDASSRYLYGDYDWNVSSSADGGSEKPGVVNVADVRLAAAGK